MVDDSSSPTDAPSARSDSRAVKVFISYRRMDTTPGDARTLKKELGARLGLENVFIDDDIPEGDEWKKVIEDTIAAAHILVVLIGAHWTSIAREKRSDEDIVRLELRAAARGRLRIVPILVDDTKMPLPEELPQGLSSLPAYDALGLRHSREDDDLKEIADRIDAIAAEIASGKVEELPTGIAEPTHDERERVTWDPDPAGPPREHFEDVVDKLKNGKVVICLGWDVNAADREEGGWNEDSGCLPVDDELAELLAAIVSTAFESPSQATSPRSQDLAKVSQHLSLTDESELYGQLERLLTDNCRPTSIHTFIARLPQILRTLGSESPHPMIVTTSYDDALEQAFREAGEEYDLAIYMAKGDSRGKFLHVPCDDEPYVIPVANALCNLPINGETNRLDRCVIVKIHGAVDKPRGLLPDRENYVVTENDYIDYLSRDKISNYVPVQILNKLIDSRVLFLGYSLSEWNLRVFVQRVWGAGGGFKNESWAVRTSADPVETKFWDDLKKMQFFDYPVGGYVKALGACLAAQGSELVST